MNISPTFLAGLATTLVAGEIFEWLPGEASLGLFALTAVVLPLPAVAAAAVWRRLRAAAAAGRRPSPWLVFTARLVPLTIPLAMLVLTVLGGLVPIAERSAPSSYTLRFLILLAPLVLMEASLRAVERHAIAWLGARRLEPAVPLGPPIGGMTALICVAVLLCGSVLDLSAVDRRIEVLFRGTTIGLTVGMILLVIGASAALPLLFRFVLPTQRRLPPGIGDELREVAGRLGFPGRRVLALRTDMRVVNAALVGPLRWPRYLVLTDGILAFLDRVALRGVVAHEIGHARAGHPALIVVVLGIVPMLLVQPLSELELDARDPVWLFAIGGALALLGWLGLRALMHRFEFEADQISAEALGGAAPCISALRRVGDLFPSHRDRSSFRHPSEQRRVQALTLWDRDPGYREAFRRRGRTLRIVIWAMLGVAIAVSGWSHARRAAVDAAIVRLYTGDFGGARSALERADPAHDRERAERLHEELDAAESLVPGGGDWESIAGRLADAAWQRGLELVANRGARAARPFFGLALSAERQDPIRESAWLWSEAVVADDDARSARLAKHLATLDDLPEALRSVLRT